MSEPLIRVVHELRVWDGDGDPPDAVCVVCGAGLVLVVEDGIIWLECPEMAA